MLSRYLAAHVAGPWFATEVDKVDFRAQRKDLYVPGAKDFSVVDVPEFHRERTSPRDLPRRPAQGLAEQAQDGAQATREERRMTRLKPAGHAATL